MMILVKFVDRHISIQTATQQPAAIRRERKRKDRAAAPMISVSFVAQFPCRSIPEPNGSVRATGREKCAAG